MLRKALLACGYVSSLLYLVAIDVVAPILRPEYHSYTSQMVSELMALGSPTRGLLIPAMSLYNLLMFPFAAGVWVSSQGRRSRRITAAALLGYGLVSSSGLLIAPMEARGIGLSDQTLLHIWTTALQGLCMVLVFVGGAFAHGARFRLYSLVSLAICLGFGALAGLEATQESMPLVGLTERVSIYAWMLWLASLAASLLPPRALPVASHGDATLHLRRDLVERTH